MKFIKKELKELKLLLHEVPSLLLVFFVLSIFIMNLLANKSLSLPFEWLALDAGFVVSWIAFLTMDILTKHFGPKAATQISILGLVINLLISLLMFVVSVIPGIWGESFVEGSENIINTAINNTFGGTWYVILGSALAFIVSAFVNNFSNYGIGKIFKNNPDSRLAYYIRAYVSTSIGQFVDNLIFALVVSHVFFGWSLVQCFTCALTGMLFELLAEVIFSPLGYRICRKWKEENVGANYLNEINKGA